MKIAVFFLAELPSCLHFTAELEENTALNTKVWKAAGLHSNGTFPLDYFSYNNSALLDVIFRHLQKTNFSGVTVSRGIDGNSMFVIASAEVDENGYVKPVVVYSIIENTPE